jgi:anaerobic magnesium-protoporphyrin IX monomethyl ester cyclase
MKGTILLLQPAVGEMDELRSSPALPLSLLHAAALAAEDFEIKIFDQRQYIYSEHERFLRRSLEDELLLVGVTSFTGPSISFARKMCQVVRGARPELPIVWGGIHASLLPRQTLADPLADFVIEGEGEVTLAALARALARGKQVSGIAGLWWKDDGEIKGGRPAELIDLESLPAPPWYIVDVGKYLPLYRHRKSFYLQSSRGCPNRCAYCYNAAFNRGRWRGLSADRTLEQVSQAVGRYGAEDIYFVDDMFFPDMRRARRIAEGMKGGAATWQVQGVDILSLKRMSDADLNLLWESGCGRLSVGIESGSPRIRKLARKTGETRDVIEVTRRLADWPFTLYYSFISGFPGETEEDLRQTVELIFELMKLNPHVHISPLYIYTPYPGTDMFEEVVRHGFTPPARLQDWAGMSDWASLSYDQANFTESRKKFYESLYFTSLFLDNKTREYTVPRLVRLLAGLYRPVARFRTRHFFFDGLIEQRVYRRAVSIWRGHRRRQGWKSPETGGRG